MICSVSLLDVDDVEAACAGRCPNDILHHAHEGGEVVADMLPGGRIASFKEGVHTIAPQFVTRSCESGKLVTTVVLGLCISLTDQNVQICLNMFSTLSSRKVKQFNLRTCIPH